MIDGEPGRTTNEENPYGNSKPLSLHPLTPEEALRRAMTARSNPPSEEKPAKLDPTTRRARRKP